MIRRLVLENWRAYDRVELDLEPGTTFVVARNGIGKTSLIEGASWALYGEAAGRPADAVRRGAKTASASLELVLPDDRVLEMTRSMPGRLTRNSLTPAASRLDGKALTEVQARRLLTETFAAEPAFLSSLTMLRGLRHGLADEKALSLEANLSRLFNVDALHKTLAGLEAVQKELKRDIALARQVTPPSAARLAALRSAAEEATRQAAAAGEAHRAAVAEERAAQQTVEAIEAVGRWQAADEERQTAVAAVAADVAALLGPTPPRRSGGDGDGPDADPAVVLGRRIDAAAAELAEKLDTARMRRAVLEDRVGTLERAMAELEDAGPDCPVCRRPLAPEDAQAAEEGHRRELDALRDEIASLDLTALTEPLDRLRAANTRVVGLRAQAPPVSPTDMSAAEAADARAAAEAASGDRLTEFVAARARADAAAADLDGAMADEKSDSALTALFRRQGVAAAASAATAAAIDGLMRQAVAPLEDELKGRWKTLFGDRGALALRGGHVTRTVNGAELPFSAFSDGEQTSAQLLLRLLVLDAATHAGFCWIDEPLEHLDPPARRHIASLLARSAATSGLRQVLVTTYEEPLARRLALRHPEDTRVVYIRVDGAGQ